jgi:hypothetical protein
MEDPDGGQGDGDPPYITALAKFTPVVFTNAIACNSGSLVNPKGGFKCNIQTIPANKPLTKVTTGQDTLTIDFIG